MKAIQKKSNLKRFIITGAALVAVAVIAVVLFFKIRPHKKTVAFYNLEKNIVNTIQEQIQNITKDSGTQFVFEVLDSSRDFNEKKLKDYDLLFTLDGALVEHIKKDALPFSKELFKVTPSTLRDADLKVMSVLLDHYESSFYTTLLKKLNLAVPQSYDGLKDLLFIQKDNIQNASLCAGRNDDELFGFISNVTLALYGSEQYKNICRQIEQSEGQVIPQELKAVLDEIKTWQHEGLIASNWYDASVQDITTFFVPERTVGTVFMSLSTHRKIQSMYLKYFETTPFAVKSEVGRTAIIAPKICALSFYKDPKLEQGSDGEKLLAALLSPEVQETLSDKTRLAPSSASSYAHDRQADDVRYWAASAKDGPLPDIGLASLASPAKRTAFAAALREYLK